MAVRGALDLELDAIRERLDKLEKKAAKPAPQPKAAKPAPEKDPS